MQVNEIGFYDSDFMSDVHWFIRVSVFCGLTYILIKIVEFVTWLFSLQWWIYLITFIIVSIVILSAYYIRYRIQKQKNTCRELLGEDNLIKEEHTEVEIIKEPIIVYSRYNCPRCNARLVKRHGPYGDFYGCEAYGQTGCRYTRKGKCNGVDDKNMDSVCRMKFHLQEWIRLCQVQ